MMKELIRKSGKVITGMLGESNAICDGPSPLDIIWAQNKHPDESTRGHRREACHGLSNDQFDKDARPAAREESRSPTKDAPTRGTSEEE